MINTLLSQDPEIAEKLFAHNNKIIQIEIMPFKINFYLFIKNKKILFSRKISHTPDTVIRGTPLNLISQKNIEVSGDMELGLAIDTVFKKLDIDWEEIISVYTGDAFAYSLSETFRKLKKPLSRFSSNFKDYIIEEQSLSVSKDEVQDFCQSVDDTRDAVERLSAKIENLTL